MGNIFSGVEIVQMGIVIEENGRDYYNVVARLCRDPGIVKAFEYLSGEEEKHIQRFRDILSQVEKYEPSEAYPVEYFAYLKALSDEHVFIKRNKGVDIARGVKTDREAIELGIGFEKDSILFYNEIKLAVLPEEQKIVDRLIDEEKRHLQELNRLKQGGHYA